ncbi:DNA-binding transcriptional LysR family regulator [Labrenzia sp. EL_13]|nr:DNA-binding transcriptional LysR family regulator [Labrenzia sp. EL_13]MBG6207009.1 DNA-binding transcriptional LysR family regulator [Labrenzia sp. EL_126]
MRRSPEADIPITVARALRFIQTSGSVSVAARSLGISQPAISKGIAQLEERLGTQLLRRGGRPILLTEEGTALAEYAERADLVQEQVLRKLDDARNNRQGSVRLGSFGSSASFHILPKTLAAFARAYPGINVEIQEYPDMELRQALEEDFVDLAVLSLGSDEGLDVIEIANDKLVALVSADHPLADRNTLKAEDLAGDPFIMTRGGSGPLVEDWFMKTGHTPRVAHTILQVNSIIALVEANLGVSVIAELALPETPGKCKVLPLVPDAPRSIGFARKEDTPRSAAAARFWSFCQKFSA